MDRRKPSHEVTELLTIMVNQTEKTNVFLERMEARLGAVDAPTAEQGDAMRQMIGRLDRLEGLAKDVLSELRVIALYATQMTRHLEREIAELRERLPKEPAKTPEP
jgi:23S rRNA G2069 N7-methylase RlmK/C1962 C5-methylase RlmI